jgi:hypothetical protein
MSLFSHKAMLGSARTLKIRSSATPRKTRKKHRISNNNRKPLFALAARFSPHVESPHDPFPTLVGALAGLGAGSVIAPERASAQICGRGWRLGQYFPQRQTSEVHGC